jgi:ATP-dependent Clp protease ATP-binding subunit ClpA
MFNRFTTQARAVVRVAQEEARALDADHVGREHLLLGVAADQGLGAQVLEPLGLGYPALRAEVGRSRGALDADALASIGIDLDEVRRRVEESFGPGALGGRRSRRGHAPFCPKAKRALELSLREALALGDRHIGPDHVLLGLASDADSGAARALARCGTTPQALRAAVLAARREAA